VDPAPGRAATAAAGRPGRPAPYADRRVVTVLFADLAGFTALGERLDPEDVRAFQNDFFAAMAAVVERYDGFVEKFVGDAVMAVFGAPVAHEDDAERALHAALAMHEQMTALSQRWQARLGEPVTLHIGVTSGPVVAGVLGAAASGQYAVTGDTVNTASRLLGAAGPGETLVAAGTYRLAHHAFALDPAEALAVKGKREPVAVYRLTGVQGPSGRRRGLESLGLRAPLVGRADDLAQLLAAFERVRGGRAQVVCIAGEAGAGKSRLVTEFLERLEAAGRLAGVAVRRATASALGEEPYGLFGAFLSDAYGLTADDDLATAHQKVVEGLQGAGLGGAEIEAILPLLAHVQGLAVEAPGPHVPPEQVRRQILLATRRLVERRLEQGPMILIAEDLQWGDSASIEMLRLIADRLVDRPLLVLGTHRPAFDARALIGERVASTIVRLAPIGRAEAGAILESFFGASLASMPSAFVDQIVERAGGNPLYLEEIVRELAAAGALRREDDTWTCTGTWTEHAVPATIRGLLISRIDRLPPEARTALQEAAVLGPTFDVELLRMISSTGVVLDAALEQLRDAELLASASGSSGRFGHTLLHEVVYQSLLLSRRAELHGRAAEAIELLCEGRPQRLEDIEALGHHFSLGDDRRRGAGYLRIAGDRARALYANEDALRHYRRALAALDGVAGAEDDQMLLRERLGDMLALVGRREEAREHYEHILEYAAGIGDRRAEGRMHRKIGGLLWDAGQRESAQERFQEALAALKSGNHPVELAHTYQELGRLAFRSGDSATALEWAQQALARAEPFLEDAASEDERLAAADVVAQAHNTRGVALARLGQRERAIEEIERSVAVATAHGLLRAACRGYTNLGVLQSTVDPRQGIATCLTGLETARKIGDLGFQSWLYANLAVAYCALTDRCEAEGIEAARQAIDLDRQLGQLDHLAVPLIVLGQILQCQGQGRRALEYYREALALAERIDEPQLLFPCYDGLGTLYLDLGDEARAEEYMQKAQAVCQRAGLEPEALIVLPFLG
jgi:adenylate cyclase